MNTKTLVARKEDLSDLADAGVGSGPNIFEEGDDEDAAPGVAAAIGAAVVDAPPAAPAPTPTGPLVPNFHGKTMRDVLAEAAAKGLIVLPNGSGIARVQFPAPGTPLREGDRIRVQFAR